MKTSINSLRLRLSFLTNLLFLFYIPMLLLLTFNTYKILINDVGFESLLIPTSLLLTNIIVLVFIERKVIKLNKSYSRLMREVTFK